MLSGGNKTDGHSLKKSDPLYQHSTLPLMFCYLLLQYTDKVPSHHSIIYKGIIMIIHVPAQYHLPANFIDVWVSKIHNNLRHCHKHL